MSNHSVGIIGYFSKLDPFSITQPIANWQNDIIDWALITQFGPIEDPTILHLNYIIFTHLQ